MKFSQIAFLGTAILGTLVHESTGQPYSQSYAPIFVECPGDVQWIRTAVGLSEAETDWVHGRKKVVLKALGKYLERLQIKDFDVSKYVKHMYRSNFEDVPTLGLAISGGGYASAYTGTAVMRALDSRLDAAVQQCTGGLLQSMTYISGLSGGGLPILSFAVNNFPTADEIVNIWRPEIDRFDNVTNNTKYAATFTSIFHDLAAKAKAGFSVGTADFFGRAWGYEFTNSINGGLDVTLSSVVNQSNFINHQMPFPILQGLQLTDSDVEYFGLKVPYPNDTTYDMTPFEFGAWGGSVSSFTPTQWLGTRLQNGSVVNESACVLGFDRAPFMLGVSAGAFNFWEIEIQSNGTLASFSKRSDQASARRVKKREEIISPSEAAIVAGVFNQTFNLSIPDISYAKIPNPFAGLDSSSAYVQKASDLSIVDGSEGGQTIPLWGQIQPARSPSFLIGWDDSLDAQTYNWNNGTNLHNTYVQAKASGIPFPIVPPASTFINRNYTTRPVFFGCNPNLTTTKDTRAPIVLYLGNAPYSSYTNFTAVIPMMSRAQMNDVFVNGFNQLTQGNGTLDAEWPVCLGCAAIERSLAKAGMKTPAQCTRCFERYCWDGAEDNAPPAIVNPSLVLDPSLGYKKWLEEHFYWNATLSL